MRSGRPKKDETREAMPMVSVRFPKGIMNEIDRLAEALPPGVVGRRSVIVRQLVERALNPEKIPCE